MATTKKYYVPVHSLMSCDYEGDGSHWLIVLFLVGIVVFSCGLRSGPAAGRRAHNPEVGGSNPPIASKQFKE